MSGNEPTPGIGQTPWPTPPRPAVSRREAELRALLPPIERRGDGRPVRYGLRDPIAFLEVATRSYRVLPGYRPDRDVRRLLDASARGQSGTHGPALVVRAEVRTLPGAPLPPLAGG